MSHSLIFGMTESGKTTLAKSMATALKSRGVGVLVLDPLNDPGWNCDFKTTDNDEFLHVYWQSRSCVAFIDESGDSVGRYDKLMAKTATRGRHYGHSNFYISQRGAQLSQTVRDQCRHLYLFTVSLADRKLLANEFNSKILLDSLKQGEYLHASRFGETQKRRIF